MKIFAQIEYAFSLLWGNIVFIQFIIILGLVIFLLRQSLKRQGFMILTTVQLGIPPMIWEADKDNIFKKANEENFKLKERMQLLEKNERTAHMIGGFGLLAIICSVAASGTDNKRSALYRVLNSNNDDKYNSTRNMLIHNGQDPNDLLNYDFTELP